MEDDNQKNLFLFLILSMLVLGIWTVFFAPPIPETDPNAPNAVVETADGTPVAPAPEEAAAPVVISRDDAIGESQRIALKNGSLEGSIALTGGLFDDVILTNYNENLGDDSTKVALLSPPSAQDAYYSFFGWTSIVGGGETPGPKTEWTLKEGTELTPETPVTLSWDNGAGLLFERKISMDDKFMFQVEQTVSNTSGADVQLMPYGIIVRGSEPEGRKFFQVHEGALRNVDGVVDEFTYKAYRDLEADAAEGGALVEKANVNERGWVAMTDKYWMTSIIPENGSHYETVMKHSPRADSYQADIRYEPVTVASGDSASVSARMFIGAKEVATIRDYQRDLDIDRFVDTVDWGWFFFITKPIFWALHLIHEVIGNMGWSIIALTFVIKALLFPLAHKSYVSMSRMKKLQPQMEKIREQAGDDRQKVQQMTMELYRKEKVNPVSGCFPILLQIPIFFSLYKVLLNTLEMRHAPWLGWIKDLSAPDPSSILNLFGLLPWAAPDATSGVVAIISLGFLPLVLGISMWLTQKLNPTPPDPTQAMIFNWMPWVFMFMMSTFMSGLILYWITNNILTFVQQYSIMRSQGVNPDILGNIFHKRRSKAEAKATQSK